MTLSRRFFFDHGALWLTLVRDVKEKLCYLALDFDTELKSTAESSDKKQTHMLSDGNMFYCQRRTFPLHECFFPANFIGIKASGVHDTSFHIMKCDVDIRVNSYIPVMLSGGTTMFQEFGDRMTKNPTELPPPTTKIKVVAPPERQYSVRFGGSVLFLFSFFQQMWVSKVSTMDPARPSSIGSVSELTMLTSRLEQQCSMEFDDVVSLRVCLLPR